MRVKSGGHGIGRAVDYACQGRATRQASHQRVEAGHASRSPVNSLYITCPDSGAHSRGRVLYHALSGPGQHLDPRLPSSTSRQELSLPHPIRLALQSPRLSNREAGGRPRRQSEADDNRKYQWRRSLGTIAMDSKARREIQATIKTPPHVARRGPGAGERVVKLGPNMH